MFKLFLLLCVVAFAAAAPGLLAGAPWASSYLAAPYTVHTGYHVINHVEPVEQHGYHIAY